MHSSFGLINVKRIYTVISFFFRRRQNLARTGLDHGSDHGQKKKYILKNKKIESFYN